MPSTADRHDPAESFRFEIRLDDLSVGGFTECSGLALETEVHEYQEGGLNTHVRKFPTRTKQTNLTLRRGIVDRLVWDWYADVVRGRIQARDGAVIVRDAPGERVLVAWQFREAFPCRWTGPELNAMQSAVAVETFELCHQGLERQT